MHKPTPASKAVLPPSRVATLLWIVTSLQRVSSMALEKRLAAFEDGELNWDVLDSSLGTLLVQEVARAAHLAAYQRSLSG
jgi:hypothetical protein